MSNFSFRPAVREISCQQCGASFIRSRKSKARFCSKSCIWKETKGPEYNAKIARESTEKRGASQRRKGTKWYVKLNGRHEYRVMAERMLGRALLPGEIVHHKDGNKKNNSPDNLEVMTQGRHMQEHGLGLPGVTPAHKPWEKRWGRRA